MGLVDEVGTDLDGLSQLRALIASGRKPGILVALDFDFIEVEAGRAVFAGTPGDHAYSRIAPFNSQNPATSQDPVSPTSLSSPIFKQIRLETRLHYPLLEPWWPG
jgi:hypothetical protein